MVNRDRTRPGGSTLLAAKYRDLFPGCICLASALAAAQLVTWGACGAVVKGTWLKRDAVNKPAQPLALGIVLFFVLMMLAASEPFVRMSSGAVASPNTHVVRGSQHRSTAVFAGGCFWGVQAVFQHVAGVTQVLSGYSGGSAETARYEIVGLGRSGHAESVEVTFDPAIVSYNELLTVFLDVAHNPAERDKQGPDIGKQYRSVIFVANEDQRSAASRALASEVARRGALATVIAPLDGFYRAEDYHQDFARLHPDNDYIRQNDAPKLAELARSFPVLYRAAPIVTTPAR